MSFFIELITLLDIVASTYVFANVFLRGYSFKVNKKLHNSNSL
jgi:hypothetical protein